MAATLSAAAGAQVAATPQPAPPRLSGRVVRAQDGSGVADARVTVFTQDLAFFREVRSAADGRYLFPALASGAHQLGVASPGLEYHESTVFLTAGTQVRDVALPSETQVGSWEVIGDTLPELFDATDIGALHPSGYLIYCHDTQNPILFNPATGVKAVGASSSSEQGCMNTTLLSDGSLLFAGGQDGANPGSFQNAIPWVKRYKPDNTWEDLPDMNQVEGRWYPGLARLNDGRVLVMGGGTAPSAERSDTCEVLDPSTFTWTDTGSMGSAVEFPPAALLYTGDVLRTWGTRPELYDVASGTWSETGQLVFRSRGFPDHSDHSILVLSDGRVLIVGARAAGATMTELYDPATGQWNVGSSPSLVRYQTEVVYLPSGQVFVGGGDIGGQPSGGEPHILGIVRRCDLLDPVSGEWRRAPDMLTYREYHGVTLLVPDGRVVTTGGTRIKFQYGPTSADIEAYSPPYLFRGVRPQITLRSPQAVRRGSTVDLAVFPDTQLTGAVLMGVQSTTHWVDGGNHRRLELGVAQSGSDAQVSLPADPDLVPLGWYLLFAMVDDIPSEAVFLKIDP